MPNSRNELIVNELRKVGEYLIKNARSIVGDGEEVNSLWFNISIDASDDAIETLLSFNIEKEVSW